MSIRGSSIRNYLSLALLPLALAGCGKVGDVSFSTDIRPILDEHCMECHKVGGEGQSKSGFSMATYDDLMKGTKFGPMVIPGDTLTSNLLVLIEGRADPSIYMPRGDHGPLSEDQIVLIRKWIEQGAKNN